MFFRVYRDQYTPKTSASKRRGHKWHHAHGCLHSSFARPVSTFINARCAVSKHGLCALNTG